MDPLLWAYPLFLRILICINGWYLIYVDCASFQAKWMKRTFSLRSTHFSLTTAALQTWKQFPWRFFIWMLCKYSFVPIMTMEIDGVSVDISFASLPSYPFKLPEFLDILSNDILRNVSEHVNPSTRALFVDASLAYRMSLYRICYSETPVRE